MTLIQENLLFSPLEIWNDKFPWDHKTSSNNYWMEYYSPLVFLFSNKIDLALMSVGRSHVLFKSNPATTSTLRNQPNQYVWNQFTNPMAIHPFSFQINQRFNSKGIQLVYWFPSGILPMLVSLCGVLGIPVTLTVTNPNYYLLNKIPFLSCPSLVISLINANL